MNWGVGLLAPLALVALSVPLLIYAVHWLFGTRRRIRVPAIFLWADLPHSAAGRRRRHVPPFTWLLLLQIAAATLGAFALARPAAPAPPPRHIALILDASATMQATDVSPSRFEAARQTARDRLSQLGESDLVSLIRAGSDAALLATGSPASIRAALDTAIPGNTQPAITEALALASTLISQTPERRGQIVLLTDVAWPTPDGVGPLAAPVEVVPVGGGSNNQSVASVLVRMNPNGRGQTAFVELANESTQAARVPVQMTADGATIDERQVDLAARTRAQLSIPLPADAHHVTVRLLGSDALALDDSLDTLAPGGPRREVDLLGVVSDGLRRAIESVPTLHVPAVGDDSSQVPALTVLAGVLPARLPAGPLMLIDPPPNSARLLGVGLGSGARIDASHPLLQGVDLVALQAETPSISGVPGWAHVVLGTEQGPLIMQGSLEGHDVVSMTFDPTVSGLEKSLAYPLLISNATSFLLAQAEMPTVPPNVSNAARFDQRESDILPRPIPTFETVNQSAPSTTPSEIWPWFAGVALALLGLEWLVFARRG